MWACPQPGGRAAARSFSIGLYLEARQLELGVRTGADASSMSGMKDDWSAAWAFVGIMIAIKIVLGVIIFIYMPLRETASLYTVVHLSAVFGVIPLLALAGGGVLFWWKVIRLRMQRRRLLEGEWQVDTDVSSHSSAT